MLVEPSGRWRTECQLVRSDVIGVRVRHETARLTPSHVDCQRGSSEKQTPIPMKHSALLSVEVVGTGSEGDSQPLPLQTELFTAAGTASAAFEILVRLLLLARLVELCWQLFSARLPLGLFRSRQQGF